MKTITGLLVTAALLVAASACDFDAALPSKIACGDASPECPSGYTCNGTVCVEGTLSDASGDGPATDTSVDLAGDITPDVAGPDSGPDAPAADLALDLPLPDGASPDVAVDASADQLVADQLVPPDKGPPKPPCPHPPVVERCRDGWCTMPPGCFSMGSDTTDNCRDTASEDQHPVTLTHSFELASTEVTNDQFTALMGFAPKASTYHCPGGSCAADGADWDEAAKYCNRLSDVRDLPSCYDCNGTGASVTCKVALKYTGGKLHQCPGFRLPTDAEWEYAYRAGTTSALYNGAIKNCTGTDSNASLIAHYLANSVSKVQPVAQKTANGWGLYDMAGNVAEWTNDFYLAGLGTAKVTDPTGLPSGTKYVIRGGSIVGEPSHLRAARRVGDSSKDANPWGFRCARTMCETRFYNDFSDSSGWSGGSLVLTKSGSTALPVITGGIYSHSVATNKSGGHNRKLAQPVTGVAFELQARVRGDNTNSGETTFGLFADTKKAYCPGGQCGYGYVCQWYAKGGSVEIAAVDGKAGQTNLAQAKLPAGDDKWHHLICKRRFDGAWEILLDGKHLKLNMNEPDVRFTTLTHVSTYLDSDSTKRALDDIQVLDCSDRGPAGRIAYVSNKGGKYETWIMDSDGRNKKQLSTKADSTGTHGAAQPRISRYGEKVAYYYKHPSGAAKNRLSVSKLDGTAYKELTTGVTPYGLDWSGGDELFFVKYVNNNEDLWVSPPGGGTPSLLWAGDTGWGIMTAIAHHPMDRKTGYIQAAPGKKAGKVCWLSDIKPSSSTCLSPSNLAGETRAMDWSAAGDKLAWFQTNGSPMDMYWVAASGGTPQKVTSAASIAGVSFGKGDKTVYYADWGAKGKLQLFRVDLTGANRVQLTSGAHDSKDPHFYPYLPNPAGTWKASAHNPVLKEDKTVWPSALKGGPEVVWDGTEYKMYYHGCTTGSTGCRSSIGMAFSPDGIDWMSYSKNPVIKKGSTSHNTEEAWTPTVIHDSGTYHMWYSACKGTCGGCGIAYATSTDGKAWTHHNNGAPVLTPSQSWEGMRLQHPTVIKDGATFRMWYNSDGCTKTGCGCTGGINRTGYATSTDGKAWTKHAKNPVFGPGLAGTYDASLAATPDVVKIGATYHMWYAAQAKASGATKIGHAMSTDGVSWTRDKVVVTSGTGWNAKGVHLPTVVVRGSFVQLWVNGYDTGSKPTIGYFAIAP